MPEPTVTAAAVTGVVFVLALAGAAVHAETTGGRAQTPRPEVAAFTASTVLRRAPRVTTLWVGADLDGDGQPDIADPTGQGPRGTDAYGEGRFRARRDGGARAHEGVDYVAAAGQPVEAPISGYVTHIGLAYPDDPTLKYVEIENPALKLTARAFYVDPDVTEGQAVEVGRPIGHAHTLQRRYRGGITDHIHLELVDRRGRRLDAGKLIVAKTAFATVATAD